MKEGKICPKCQEQRTFKEMGKHSGRTDGMQVWCKYCRKKNHIKNRKKHLEEMRKWYKKNKKKRQKYCQKYYLEHREDLLERAKKREQKYVEEQNSKYLARTARRNHKRRSLNEQAENTLTEEEWWIILENQENQCASCEREFSEELFPTRDHIIPISKGGSLIFGNTQALCLSCNSSKGDTTIDYR